MSAPYRHRYISRVVDPSVQILASLLDGGKRLVDIHEETGIAVSTLHQALYRACVDGYVERDGNIYRATEKGVEKLKRDAEQLSKLLNTINRKLETLKRSSSTS